MPENPTEEPIERFRPYLTMLARTQMSDDIRRRHEPSDMVQLTLLQAHRARAQYRGGTTAELAAWLRQILAHNLAHAHRDLHRAKRDLKAERSLEAALERSSACFERWLRSEETSPSQRVARTELMLRVAHCIEDLPETQRDALVLHYWKEEPLAEVARVLDRTPSAVAGLIHRALANLRRNLTEEER